MLLSDNGVSKVWREGDWVYKRQPKYMTDNEIWYLNKMFKHGVVPYAEQVEIELIRIEYIKRVDYTDYGELLLSASRFLDTLFKVGIRHGDLTEPHVFTVADNKILVIDWSESRLLSDPIEDKRPEGDDYWLWKTMSKLKK